MAVPNRRWRPVIVPAKPKRSLTGARAPPAAPSAAIDVFALASSRLYDEIARNDPQPFKQRLAAVTRDWACHRVGGSVSPTGRRLGSGGSC